MHLETCTCGHQDDEHEDTAMAPCTVEGCDCLAFEPGEPVDDDDFTDDAEF